ATSGTLVVTNSAPTQFTHSTTPAGIKLTDGSYLWAYLSVKGALYVRRNVGTLAEPAWRDAVLVRDTTPGFIGADVPNLAKLGSTLALFHTYTDGTYYQVWMTTSTDDGTTWSAPVQVTTESGH